MDDTTPATMLADRALLRLSGEDVRGFLQGLLTNDVTGALPVWAGLLTPQGKALFDLIVWADGDDLLLDVEREQRDAIARRLTMYRLRRAITIAPEDGLAVHWSRDASGPTLDPRLAALGARWLAPPASAAADWHARRLSLGVAEGVADLGSGETLWLEANARELNGVSFTKGCYVGQENTARMHHRDKVRRRLVVAPIDESDARRRSAYPELGWMVTLRRVDALGEARVPDWLAAVIAAGAGDT
ncbi:CAF17-like 4Fe-4S cluster assembly/insertion protein YgfZ [Sphingomonas sp. 8AM]|uniref:CAF17-like 4Fe-4S cluster assembly/insertion protein YgfZ n=1 Tax=Sphingomonas sp. 8AM TaxID=2653170 RepID=UPI0012EFC646|nr:folate-binding protein [Sphingomonas sp. 8AM]VXC67247.1 Aminomethyltransferase [Sphingomonas sp. 8AM]